MKVVGIDPGISGAICLLDDRRFVAVTDLPTQNKFTDNEKQEIDGVTLAKLLLVWMPGRVVVERVQASPTYGGRPIICPACKKMKNGIAPSSAMNFGDIFGQIKGVVRALAAIHEPLFELVLIGPARWKNLAGIEGDDRRDKEASRSLAIKLFPDGAHELLRKKDDGRAEALLIALYGGFQQATHVPVPGKSRRGKITEQAALL
jgi:crossover junction endodeoxyribonuclease RuvC